MNMQLTETNKPETTLTLLSDICSLILSGCAAIGCALVTCSSVAVRASIMFSSLSVNWNQMVR